MPKQAMTMEVFIGMLKDAASDCGEAGMRAAIYTQGATCHFLRHGSGPQSGALVVGALEQQLRARDDFGPSFQIPTDLLDDSQNVAQFRNLVCALAGLVPDNVPALQLT